MRPVPSWIIACSYIPCLCPTGFTYHRVTYYVSGYAGFFHGLTKVLARSSAQEFVSNSSKNVLVVGANETTRSDLRIFNADGGDLMRKMAASPEFFAQTCQNLLERMINTVPKGVKLTEIVNPIRVKPALNDIVLMPEGKAMSILGTVRVRIHLFTRLAPAEVLTIMHPSDP